MIQSKKEYLYYLECDKIAMRRTRKHPAYKHDIIWTFERLLRKCEYYENCKHDIFSKFYGKFLKLQYVNLSHKLGFSIGFNTCGPGLCIEHYGNVVINQHAKIGCNCHIIGSMVIGATEDDKFPIIGNNVFIGFGAAIIGNVTIADGVAIGANAVVSKDILTPNVSVGGVPAKVISQRGSEGYLIKATEIVVK
ncbi:MULTISPECIES: serine O-acetyltransferase [Bacteroides]|jgi:serine O-acetyltransferase|uniref:serine O-acetyltransferase n=1 Tax=Bacteroides TaxID=816 RepID=UPI0003413F55|nr:MULTISPECIES: serine O-acetyltransferase [Bacteroides]UYU46501.1 serine acetyltransferase [Bacteroides salyersiae]CCY49853.1 serine O-acetyltransferase [Bacteroides sp. CAG:189]